MQQIKEQLAYLKGLAEGLNVGQSSPEGRVLLAMMEAMNEMVRSMDRLYMQQDQLESYLEAIDDDLTDLENEVFEEYDEDLEDLAIEYELEDDDDIVGMDDLDDSAIEYMEMACPNCGETVFVDEDVFESDEVVEVLCPECEETVLVNDPSLSDEGDLS